MLDTLLSMLKVAYAFLNEPANLSYLPAFLLGVYMAFAKVSFRSEKFAVLLIVASVVSVMAAQVPLTLAMFVVVPIDLFVASYMTAVVVAWLAVAVSGLWLMIIVALWRLMVPVKDEARALGRILFGR